MSEPRPEPLADDEPRAADGRVPGRRGRATRRRLLGHTGAMLRSTSYRDLRVIDIAREAGTSPATFYQYFADVEEAVLVLAEDLDEDAQELAGHVAARRWTGDAGYATAESLVDAFLGFWERHRAVLRVVELATTEGDRRFRAVWVRLFGGVAIELAAVTESFQAAGGNRGVDARANAGVVVTLLASVAAHRGAFEPRGMAMDEIRTAVARQVYRGITGQPAPGAA